VKPAGDDPQRLKDSSGKPTPASVLWTVEKTNRILSYPESADDRMRRGYLDTTGLPDKSLEVVVEDIPYAQYDVVVYVGSEFFGSRGSVEINGQKTYFKNSTVKHTPPNRSLWDAYQEATAQKLEDSQPASHVVFRNLESRQITFAVKAEGSRNSGVHGLQIREVK
jgi:hypothetical protein